MAAYATSHITRMISMQGERMNCKHCGKIGHEEANCYELIGYPPGWGSRGVRGARGRGHGIRGGCTSVGHGRGREAAYVAHATSIDTATSSAKEHHPAAAAMGFTPEPV